jgi:hypothetical protein
MNPRLAHYLEGQPHEEWGSGYPYEISQPPPPNAPQEAMSPQLMLISSFMIGLLVAGVVYRLMARNSKLEPPEVGGRGHGDVSAGSDKASSSHKESP